MKRRSFQESLSNENSPSISHSTSRKNSVESVISNSGHLQDAFQHGNLKLNILEQRLKEEFGGHQRIFRFELFKRLSPDE